MLKQTTIVLIELLGMSGSSMVFIYYFFKQELLTILLKNTKRAMVMSPNLLDKILKDKINFEIFKKSFISVGAGP